MSLSLLVLHVLFLACEIQVTNGAEYAPEIHPEADAVRENPGGLIDVLAPDETDDCVVLGRDLTSRAINGVCHLPASLLQFTINGCLVGPNTDIAHYEQLVEGIRVVN